MGLHGRGHRLLGLEDPLLIDHGDRCPGGFHEGNCTPVSAGLEKMRGELNAAGRAGSCECRYAGRTPDGDADRQGAEAARSFLPLAFLTKSAQLRWARTVRHPQPKTEPRHCKLEASLPQPRSTACFSPSGTLVPVRIMHLAAPRGHSPRTLTRETAMAYLW
jgi:hypothetical protein